MKIRIRYEDQITTIDVPEEDCAVTIQADFEMRLAATEDKTSVKPRSMQEIMDELNRDDYSNWRRYNRHLDLFSSPKRLDGKRGLSRSVEDAEESALDLYPDFSDVEDRTRNEDYEAVCQFIRSVLKPANADLVIAVVLEGMTVRAYARMTGDDENNVSHRLKYSEKILKKSFDKFSDFGFSHG